MRRPDGSESQPAEPATPQPPAALAEAGAPSVTPAQVAAWQAELAGKQPYHVMEHALTHFGTDLLVSFSGAEDVLVVDLAHQIAGRDVRVFTLDTGRLHPETYAFIDAVRSHYGIAVDVRFPDAAAVQQLVRAKGLFSFRQDGHKECCGVRKVAPLRQALAGARAWATGQRHDQSPDTRADVPHVQLDPAFTGSAGPLVKYNPLANWSSAQVWRFIRGAGLPFNKLHERGFVSIGCEPCTRAVLPGEHERAGRWWWEEATAKECGLHVADEGA